MTTQFGFVRKECGIRNAVQRHSLVKADIYKFIAEYGYASDEGKELIVTATTGSAAVEINGSMVHSTASIPIETSDGKRIGKLKKHQRDAHSN
jgi:hypothetical protein